MFVEDYPTANARSLVRYRLGDDDTLSDPQVMTNISRLMTNGNVDLEVNDYGIALGQKRYHFNNTPDSPSFVVADHHDNVLYNSGEHAQSFACSSGAVALGPDNLLAVASDFCSDMVSFFRLHWPAPAGMPQRAPSSTGIIEELPEMTLRLNAGAGQVGQLAFDPAGNLHVAAQNQGYSVYALPHPNGAEVISEAPEVVESDGTGTGIDAVDATPVTLIIAGDAVTVSGLRDGETVSIYTTAGILVYQGDGAEPVTLLPGAYILSHSHGAIKFGI